MNKQELVSYLVGLQVLVEAHSKSAHSVPSKVLGDEFEKHWGMLKEQIQKEKENEAKQSEFKLKQPRSGDA